MNSVVKNQIVLSGALVVLVSLFSGAVIAATNAAALPNGWVLKINKLEKKESDVCDLQIEYPTIEATSVESAAVTAVRTKINAKILSKVAVDQKLSSYNEAVKDVSKNCVEDYRDHEGSPYTDTTAATVTFVGKQHLSLNISDSSYEGGAHPLFYADGLTVDLETGKDLQLNEILNFNKPMKMNQLLKDAMRQACDKTDTDCLGFAAEYSNDTALSLSRLTFSISKKALIVNDNDLPHALQAYGLMSIPWSKLQTVLKPSSPIGKIKTVK